MKIFTHNILSYPVHKQQTIGRENTKQYPQQNLTGGG